MSPHPRLSRKRSRATATLCAAALVTTPGSVSAWAPLASIISTASSRIQADLGTTIQPALPTLPTSTPPFDSTSRTTTRQRPEHTDPGGAVVRSAGTTIWLGADDKHSIAAIVRHLDEADQHDIVNALELLSGLAFSGAHQLQARETAEMVAEACGDKDVVLAAILFQAVQDGKLSVETIASEMGANVAQLTQNSAEVIQLQADSRELLWAGEQTRVSSSQAENLRNLLITMSSDWRVVTLALVHQVRHLSIIVSADPEGRSREAFIAAREALDVYAPLAHRLGMHQLKNELENLGFKHLYPQQHQLITEQLADRAEKHEVLLSEQLLVLKRVLQEDTVFMNNIDSVVVEGRQKSPYSTWRKLLKISHGQLSKGKHLDAVDQVLDAIALRVVLKPDTSAGQSQSVERGEALCYHVLEQVHAQWAHMDFRVKDYIARPKENGYQALHTTCTMRYHGVVYPFEIQVRTQEMHRVAEWGKAAHFRYKEATAAPGAPSTAMAGVTEVAARQPADAATDAPEPMQWLLTEEGPMGSSREYVRSLTPSVVEVDLPVLDTTTSSAREYANRLHDELQEHRVYIFSEGQILDLERGVTVKDALSRQFDAGRPTHAGPAGDISGGGFRVNGRWARADYELRNGDQLMAT